MIEENVFHPVLASDCDANVIIIPSHMVIKNKYTADGNFDKTKARLVANGSYIDRSLFPDRGSPTSNIATSYMQLSDACIKGKIVRAHDIKGYFLKSNANKSKNKIVIVLQKSATEVLTAMHHNYLPFVRSDGTMYCELDRQLYGTLEAAKAAYEDLKKLLLENSFVQCEVEQCLFRKQMDDGDQLLVSVYVDDLLVTCMKESTDQYFQQLLIKRYGQIVTNIPDKDGVFYYLRMRIQITADSWTITQPDHIKQLIVKYNIKDYSKVISPYIFNYDASGKEGKPADTTEFLSLLSSIRYIAQRTRPDTLMALALISGYCTQPLEHHYNFLINVMKYIANTINMGVCFHVTDDSPKLEMYCDSSFAIHKDGKSHTGVIAKYGGNMIMTACKKQTAISRSSTEAELLALNFAASEFNRLRSIVNFIANRSVESIMYQDNEAVIGLVQRTYIPRSKHFNVKFEYVKSLIDSGNMKVKYLSTTDMLADLLTKPLYGVVFRNLRNKIMNINF
jgi:hypothetical protein